MPLAFLKAGNKWLNKPDCSVDVVDDITIDWACASRHTPPKTANAASLLAWRKKDGRFFITVLLEQKLERQG
jgi:hypothetical protein